MVEGTSEFKFLPDNDDDDDRILHRSAPLTFSVRGEVKPGGMSEGAVDASPQVFVVDSQANYIGMPREKKQQWMRASNKFLLLLVGLVLLGLLVEGYFIYQLYQKTESLSHRLCQNQSNPKTADQQDGSVLSQVGPKEFNQIPTGSTTQSRPFAHLLGSRHPLGEGNVVQWVKEGEAVSHNMKFDNDGLIVEVEGYYYLYSKVQINAADECLLIQHKVLRGTSAYGNPIELMKSRSFRCWTPRPSNARSSDMEDLWNNFLAGIFYLKEGDKIFVKLESTAAIQMRPGLTENFIGAFMVSP